MFDVLALSSLLSSIATVFAVIGGIIAWAFSYKAIDHHKGKDTDPFIPLILSIIAGLLAFIVLKAIVILALILLPFLIIGFVGYVLWKKSKAQQK